MDRGIGGTGTDDNDLDSARGVIVGIMMGTACWAVIALFWWVAR